MLGSRRRTKIGAWVTATLLALALTAGPAQARPGGLDRGFGHNGKVLGFDGLYEGISGIASATAPNGGTYLAATDLDPTYVPGNGSEWKLRLRHYLRDGQLDTGFGNGGTLSFDPPLAPGLHFSFRNLAVDQQDRLLIFGASQPPSQAKSPMYPSLYEQPPSYATVFRLLPDGSPDPSFGSDGVVVLNFATTLPPLEGAYRVSATAGTVDSQGRPVFLVSRTEYAPDTIRPFLIGVTRLLARLTVSGDPDPSFGNGTGAVPLDRIAGARELALGPGDRIVLGLSAENRKTMLLALDASGNPSPGFGPGIRSYQSGLDLTDLTVDRFGRTLLVGSGWPRTERKGAPQKLARVAADGSLDRSFGKRGRLTVKLPTHSALRAVETDGKGRVLLTGEVLLPGPYADWRSRSSVIGVLRFLSSGKPDRSFGHRGRVLTNFGNGSSSMADELALDGNGHLTVSGLARWPGPTWNQRTQVLVRYDLR